MDFAVEDLSPVRKKITVSAGAVEVDAALNSALRRMGRDFSMPGFRRGKVPPGVIERRFGDEMRNQAAEDFLGGLETFLTENDIVVLSRPVFDGGGIARGQDFSCTLDVDVMPDFAMPAYVGMKVEQDEVVVRDEFIEETLQGLRGKMAREVPVTEARLPVDGDIVDVDYAGFENNEPLADVKGEHFRMTLGTNQSLPDFEAIVRSLLPGGEKEGPVAFPDDYGYAPVAGKTLVMRVTLNSLSESVRPEMDDAFAKSLAQENMDALRETIATSLRVQMNRQAKAGTQQKLMDDLLAQVDFPLPERMVALREKRILDDARMRLGQSESPGRSAEDQSADSRNTGDQGAAAAAEREKALDAMRPEARREAEKLVRIHLLLTAVARRENIRATRAEADMQLYAMAMNMGQDFKKLQGLYSHTGLMDELLERIRADKAMDFIYGKAEIVTIPAAPEQSGPAGDQIP